MEVPVLPWERIDWSDEYVQKIYREWGLFYTRQKRLDKAAKYYDKSLQLKKDDSRVIYFRSQCKRKIAQTQEALDDALSAAEILPENAGINQEICDALYELNQFENCKMFLHDNSRKYSDGKVKWFLKKLNTVNRTLNDSVGDSLSPFILENENIFPKMLEQLDRKKFVDSRPLWKIRRDQNNCDVLSTNEKEEDLLSPREVARRECAFKILNQIYYNRTWIDVLFLKSLRENPNLLLQQCKVTTPILRDLINTKYGMVTTFLKMLHARSPLYNTQVCKRTDRNIWEKQHQKHLNQIQYQTRRNMLTILRTIRRLRALGKIKKLSRYVEEVMGDYVVLKTHRVMPWKFEFINEVYNTLALAYAYIFTAPPDMNIRCQTNMRLKYLLKLPVDTNIDRSMKFVFGNKSTYREPDAIDNSLIAYKKYIARLEKRMQFAKYSIEKCYLLHEIARSHLTQNHYGECCSVARHAIEETKNCNSFLWRFLSILLICKSHAMLHKVEQGKEALDEAYECAEMLKSEELAHYIDVCRVAIEAEMSMRKKSIDSVPKQRIRSMFDHFSDTSSYLTENSIEEDKKEIKIE